MASASQVSAGSAQQDAVARAHEQVLADKTLQFDLRGFDKPPAPPDWLKWVFEAFGALAPLLKVVFWGGLAAAVGVILFFIGRELVRLRWTGKARAVVLKSEPAPEWRPEAAAARTLLEDADRLAAAGRFAEAVHLLLFRSIEDLQGRRPRAVRPALTTRDIAALDDLPASARPAFAKIAEAVERSFFGGRPVDADTFYDCRRAYEAFALPGGWS